MCVVRTIEAILKTSKMVEDLKHASLEDLPTVKKVMGRIKSEWQCDCHISRCRLKELQRGSNILEVSPSRIHKGCSGVLA